MNLILTTLIHGPSILVKAAANPYWGVLVFVYLPLSVFVWQASLIMLFIAGKKKFMEKMKEVIFLNVLYLFSAAYSVGVYVIFPAVFY